MARCRFVTPDSVRILLPDQESWIEVKRELNTGDQKRLEAAGLKPPVNVDGKIINPIDWAVYEIERAAVFLTDWSFRGTDDKPVPLSLDAIRALDVETFDEINTAIYEHVGQQAIRKKVERTLRAEATIPLPDDSAVTSS